MIRSVLASPWLPLLYWAAAVIATIYVVRHKSLKRRLGHDEFQAVVSASSSTAAPSHDNASTPAPQPAKQAIPIMDQLPRFWFPQIYVLQRPDSSLHRKVTKIATNRTPISTEIQTAAAAPITMLTIHADPPGQALTKTLTIQCRTDAVISNSHRRTVTIHGVVTQEVVSSAGKILIMAGSRVVGSGLLDPENARFKSDGLWSVFFDDTELKIEAKLLDRPSGLPGILGQEMSNEAEALQTETLMRDGRAIFVPRNAPFVLELHGEVLLRDLNSNAASN